MRLAEETQAMSEKQPDSEGFRRLRALGDRVQMQVLRNLAGAQRLGDWNAEVARLVALLATEATPPDLHDDPKFVRWRLELEMAIARGFGPSSHRPLNLNEARADAMLIQSSDATSVPDAARELVWWYKSALTGRGNASCEPVNVPG